MILGNHTLNAFQGDVLPKQGRPTTIDEVSIEVIAIVSTIAAFAMASSYLNRPRTHAAIIGFSASLVGSGVSLLRNRITNRMNDAKLTSVNHHKVILRRDTFNTQVLRVYAWMFTIFAANRLLGHSTSIITDLFLKQICLTLASSPVVFLPLLSLKDYYFMKRGLSDLVDNQTHKAAIKRLQFSNS